MNRADKPPAKRMRDSWNRVHFTNLYREVLDKKCGIRVKRVRPNGTYELETYTKHGWWIFKRKWPVHTYIMDPENGTICQLTLRYA